MFFTTRFQFLCTALAMLLFATSDSAYAEIVIEFEDTIMGPGQTGAVDVFARSTDGEVRVGTFSGRFRLGNRVGDGVLEFLPTFEAGNDSTQSDSERGELNYLFHNQSDFFSSTRQLDPRELVQSDSTFSADGVVLGSDRRLVARLELRHVIPESAIPNFSGAEYSIELERNPNQTFFLQNDQTTEIVIAEESYSTRGTITITAIPEPHALALLSLGLAIGTLRRRRPGVRKRKSTATDSGERKRVHSEIGT